MRAFRVQRAFETRLSTDVRSKPRANKAHIFKTSLHGNFNTRRRNFDFSEDARAPFFMRVHLSSGFHPVFIRIFIRVFIRFHPVPSGSIRFHPVPSGSIRVSGAGPVYTRFCLPRHRLNLVLGIKLACTEFLPPHTSPPRYRHNEEVDFCA